MSWRHCFRLAQLPEAINQPPQAGDHARKHIIGFRSLLLCTTPPVARQLPKPRQWLLLPIRKHRRCWFVFMGQVLKGRR